MAAVAPVSPPCLFCDGTTTCPLCPPASKPTPTPWRKFSDGAVPAWARRATFTQQRRAAKGLHPLGLPLAAPGETCGTCVHLVRAWGRRTYFKCALSRQSRGPATDTRVSWPACTGWLAVEVAP